MSDELKKLADARDDLLLAEVAAWLHDIGKCTSEFAYFLSARSTNNLDPYKAIFTVTELRGYQFSPQRIQERLDEANQQYALHMLLNAHVRETLDARFSIGRQDYTFREAVYFSRPRFAGNIGRPLGRAGDPLDLLAYCHGEGHAEKEEPLPSITSVTVARHSAFGFQLAELPDPNHPKNLTQRLNNLIWEGLLQQGEREPLRQLFSDALGDTRFPINEITLWDWSTVVASLYKAELARYYLTGEWRKRNNLRWRLLRVNFDVLGLYSKAIKIADLLGYRRAVDEGCAAVKQLVEEEYPLGNEVYRDTTGIYFTFPDLPLPDDLEREIRHHVEAIEAELAPRIAVEPPRGNTATEQLKRMLADARQKASGELAQPFVLENLSPCWQQQWSNVPDGNFELCPVCRLRPMKEHAEACETCVGRRRSRTETWLRDPSQTIWMDEIADNNGRVALVVGKFGLDDWLSGDLVQSMLVRADPQKGEFVPKNPSPARLRRVWETCQRFWVDTVEHRILLHHPYGTDSKNAALRCHRLTIEPHEKDPWEENIPFDGTLNGRPISLLRDRSQRHFITVINLQLTTGEDGSLRQLQQAWPGCVVEGHDSVDPRKRRHFTIQKVEQAQGNLSSYRPFLTLLTSPDQFLALVPASEAMDVTCKIRCEYQEQFGKVQNRLPLFLGLVFFQRKMPLMAVMDTARRMMDVRMANSEWQIAQVSSDGQNVTLELEQIGQRIRWVVPVVMGDGKTPDYWYPYFELVGTPVAHHSYRFECGGKTWVHVKNLQEGETVRVSPSRFAYLFLENTAQRFQFDPATGAMLLDELPLLREMWRKICGSPDMSDTKLQAIYALFEGKRQEWRLGEPTLTQPITDEIFRRLIETTLSRDKVQGVKVEDVLNGRFRGCLNLYLHILKRRVSDERKNKEAQK